MSGQETHHGRRMNQPLEGGRYLTLVGKSKLIIVYSQKSRSPVCRLYFSDKPIFLFREIDLRLHLLRREKHPCIYLICLRELGHDLLIPHPGETGFKSYFIGIGVIIHIFHFQVGPESRVLPEPTGIIIDLPGSTVTEKLIHQIYIGSDLRFFTHLFHDLLAVLRQRIPFGRRSIIVSHEARHRRDVPYAHSHCAQPRIPHEPARAGETVPVVRHPEYGKQQEEHGNDDKIDHIFAACQPVYKLVAPAIDR